MTAACPPFTRVGDLPGRAARRNGPIYGDRKRKEKGKQVPFYAERKREQVHFDKTAYFISM
jgi:hypothetical protein